MFKPKLGASLYIPATHKDLLAIAEGKKLNSCRSIIFCLEDAVGAHELETAVENLALALKVMQKKANSYRFIRTRTAEFLDRLLMLEGIENIDGFVLPKFTKANQDAFMGRLQYSKFWVMPTLETLEVFDDQEMKNLAAILDQAKWREQVLSLRIGGNDLFSLLKMRRPRHCTIYETSIGQIISRLITTFVPFDFNISAPVFEYFDDVDTLSREVTADLQHGLVGKTAIHPDQIPIIEQHYKISEEDINQAQRILAADAPGVFQLNGAMCEPATHRSWSKALLHSLSLEQAFDNNN